MAPLASVATAPPQAPAPRACRMTPASHVTFHFRPNYAERGFTLHPSPPHAVPPPPPGARQRARRALRSALLVVVLAEVAPRGLLDGAREALERLGEAVHARRRLALDRGRHPLGRLLAQHLLLREVV